MMASIQDIQTAIRKHFDAGLTGEDFPEARADEARKVLDALIEEQELQTAEASIRHSWRATPSDASSRPNISIPGSVPRRPWTR